MKTRSAARVLGVIAGAAMFVTVVGATISTFHNGSTCIVYNDGKIVFQQVCAPGQTAHCDIVYQPNGTWVVESWCEGEPTPDPH